MLAPVDYRVREKWSFEESNGPFVGWVDLDYVSISQAVVNQNFELGRSEVALTMKSLLHGLLPLFNKSCIVLELLYIVLS